LPYSDFGTTIGYTDDYDEICPFDAPLSPDVVYSYAPAADEVIDITLCVGSAYDTKLYVYENVAGSLVACNDDACTSPNYLDPYVSSLFGVSLFTGNTYYIVVDGYGGDAGDYTIDITYNESCDVVCPSGGIAEGEPACGDGYVDMYNGGCNSDPDVWQAYTFGDVICGTSGNYVTDLNDRRDTDWFRVELTESGTITWKAVAEFPVLVFIINAGTEDCGDYVILTSATADPCDTATATAGVGPGIYWLWVGPQGFTGWPCVLDYVAVGTFETGGEPPLNDDCFNVVPVELTAGSTLTFNGDNTNATFNDCSVFSQYADVWEAFYTSEPLIITLDYCTTSPAFGNAWLNMALDCDCVDFTAAATFDITTCGDNNVTMTWGLLPAGTYYYPVLQDPANNAVGPYTIHVNAEAPPPCFPDFFVTDVGTHTGNICGAGDDCTLRVGEDHIYEITITSEELWTFALCNTSSPWDTYIYLGTACCSGDLAENDDGCGYPLSTISAYLTPGTYYLTIEGWSSSDCGEYQLDISVPAGHDVGATGILSPRAGELLDGVTPVDVIANVGNFGANAETFDVIASDDHSFLSVYSGLTLNPGEVLAITFPDQYLPTQTCEDYNLTVETQLGTDDNPANDAFTALFRVPRTPDQTFQYDDDVLVNAWYFFDEANLAALQYVADADKEIVYLGARTYVDELGSPWPDATADPFRLYLFLDSDLDNFPDLDPVASATVLPTGVSPSFAYGVLDCGVQVANGDNFWVAFGNINDSPDYGSEGIAQDAASDYFSMKWYLLSGAWTQGEYYAGDEFLRAYALTPQGGGCDYVVGDINGNGAANGIDVTFGVSYFKGGNNPPIDCNPPCAGHGDPFYAAGDVNGNCAFNGIDITYFVAYLKGSPNPLMFCPDCPPARLQAVGQPVAPTTVPAKAKANTSEQ
jgi:hypothetical protein